MEEASLIESDSVALIKGCDNSSSWLTVYLDPDNNCFVKRDGAWLSVFAAPRCPFLFLQGLGVRKILRAFLV